MKNHLIISLLFLSIGFGQNKNDEPNPMKGVKTQIESIYEFEEKFGEFNEILKMKTISTYDSNGNQVEESVYDSEGSLDDKTIYTYDSDGKKVEDSYYDSEGNLTEGDWGYSKSISKYDTKNRIVELIKYNFGLKFGQLQQTLTEKYIYEYEEY